MTQPPNPGQPFYQQQPSAPSAPVPGQPYPPQQQQFQGAPGAPGAPGQPYPQAPAGDSFMGNLFDTAKPFAEKFGKVYELNDGSTTPTSAWTDVRTASAR